MLDDFPYIILIIIASSVAIIVIFVAIIVIFVVVIVIGDIVDSSSPVNRNNYCRVIS